MFRFVWPGRFGSGALGRPSRSAVINYTHHALHTPGPSGRLDGTPAPSPTVQYEKMMKHGKFVVVLQDDVVPRHCLLFRHADDMAVLGTNDVSKGFTGAFVQVPSALSQLCTFVTVNRSRVAIVSKGPVRYDPL